jgi:hypothetical protein
MIKEVRGFSAGVCRPAMKTVAALFPAPMAPEAAPLRNRLTPDKRGTLRGSIEFVEVPAHGPAGSCAHQSFTSCSASGRVPSGPIRLNRAANNR